VFILRGFICLCHFQLSNLLLNFCLKFFIQICDCLMYICNCCFELGFQVSFDFVGDAFQFHFIIEGGIGRCCGVSLLCVCWQVLHSHWSWLHLGRACRWCVGKIWMSRIVHARRSLELCWVLCHGGIGGALFEFLCIGPCSRCDGQFIQTLWGEVFKGHYIDCFYHQHVAHKEPVGNYPPILEQPIVVLLLSRLVLCWLLLCI